MPIVITDRKKMKRASCNVRADDTVLFLLREEDDSSPSQEEELNDISGKRDDYHYDLLTVLLRFGNQRKVQ